MTGFAHDQIKPFSEGGSKTEQVGDMFDQIAPRYDFLNRFLSAGIDTIWRKRAIHCFKKDKPRHLLDVATGTGDMALTAARLLQPDTITGIDISEKMLAIGRKKVQKVKTGTKIELVRGDSETINFPACSFDGVMVAFGVRNFEHLEQGLNEILRVMKPGAQLVVLEFSKPTLPVIRPLYRFYMSTVAPQLARWFSSNKKAYQYLNASARAFPDRGEFEAILKKTGYADTVWKPLSLGICCIYSGRKPMP